MKDLSLHILDITENSINAGAKYIRISINEDTAEDRLTIEIEDDGKGIKEEVYEKVTDPFYTTRTTRKVGLGIPLLKQASLSTGGDFKIISRNGDGTKVIATFIYSNIDRKPLGNIGETLTTLFLMAPDVEFNYTHIKDGNTFSLNTKEIKEDLGIDILTDIKVLKDLKVLINNKLKEL